MRRFRGFGSSLLLASLLAGAGLALAPAPTGVRIAAASLTVGIWIVGAEVVTGRSPRRLWWLVLLSAALVALFAVFRPQASTWSPRALHDAALLSYAAIAIAAALAPVRVIGEGRALLVTFSAVIVLFGADLLVKPPPAVWTLEWQMTTMADPDVEYRVTPNSTALELYPDNPRGYFDQTHPGAADTWSLALQQGSAATLEHVASEEEEDDVLRVAITRRTGTEAWRVALQQAPFTLTRGASYLLTFRAQSGAPRRVSCELGQNQPPWGLDGEYREVTVDTQWKNFQCAFTATSNETNARVILNVASSDAPIEFADVVLHNRTTDRDETPTIPASRFFISYRFNSLGFRGPDYAVPRPAGTFRILALGDSFAQGEGVREHDTFESVLQDHLNAAGRPGAMHYEVINAALSGYATRQELRSSERFSSQYDAQVVLLMMVFNDDMSYLDEVRRGLAGTGVDEGGLTNLVHRAKQSTRAYDYTDTISALQQLEDATTKRGAKLAVVLFTNGRYAPWDKLDAAVRPALAGTGVPLLNLKDAMLGHGRTESELIVHPLDPHPNEIAHRIAAGEIERFLASEHLLP